MGLAIRMAAAVTPPVLIGVLVWWGVMLAAPVVLISALATTASRRAATSALATGGTPVGGVRILAGWISERRCGARATARPGRPGPLTPTTHVQPSAGALAPLDQAPSRQGGSDDRALAVGLVGRDA